MISLPQAVKRTIDTLKGAGFETYAVGGSVRDMLMGLTTKTWDFTTSATPTEILTLFPDGFYDNDFGTVGIPIKNAKGVTEDIFEITTYRSEKGYSNKRHPDKISWGVSLEEDLKRRDFTVNAIAFDGTKLIDPYKGQIDIDKKIIKTVGSASERFAEDALRLLRAVRLATQLRFTIDAETLEAIKKHADLITEISADRIRQELMKLIASPYAGEGILLLRASNLLNKILPEVEKSFGISQKSPKRHHVYDVGTHLVMSLHHSPSTDPIVRFATLLHDVGKPKVFRKDAVTQIITFYNHEVIGAKMTGQIAKRLNFSNKDRERLVTLVRWHQFTVDEQQTDATLRRFIKRVGKENLKDMLDLRIGDRLGGGAQETSWRLRLFMSRLEEVQKQPFTVSDLKIDGHDVMRVLKINPGRRVGEILNKLFDAVILQKIKNERETLLKELEKYI